MSSIWAMQDLGSLRIPVKRLAGGDLGRNPFLREVRLGEQFLAANRAALNEFSISGNLSPDADGVSLRFQARHQIGAMALASPNTGRPEFGLIVHPRFGWRSVGALMMEVGAKVMPEMPRLPSLPRSEHEVPRWVLAAIVLSRLEALMQEPNRKFQLVSTSLLLPKGRIDWNEYVSRKVAQCRPDSIPCSFSELQEDQALLGAVHAAVIAQLRSLQQVKSDAYAIARLLLRFEAIRRRVSSYPPSWAVIRLPRTILRPGIFLDALEAIDWTHDERGLAGKSEYAGLPWRLSMEKVFEARVESWAKEIARQSGGIVRSGRLRETQRAIRWEPAFAGSQRSLLPDVEIVREGETIVFDAKYKAHWEDIDAYGWDRAHDELRESHRNDLMQVLAYGASAPGERVVCVLVYPCKVETWNSLVERKRILHQASISAGSRSVTLVLAAIPFDVPLAVLATAFVAATGSERRSV